MDKTGWKNIFCHVNNTNKMNRLLKAARSKQLRTTVKIKSGMNIPRDHKDAMLFYANNDNTNWKYAELLKLKQIYNFDPFNSIGPVTSAPIPPGHTKIQVHLIYEYKQYGRYMERMVAYGNMNEPNLGTYYSSTISLYSIQWTEQLLLQ